MAKTIELNGTIITPTGACYSARMEIGSGSTMGVHFSTHTITGLGERVRATETMLDVLAQQWGKYNPNSTDVGYLPTATDGTPVGGIFWYAGLEDNPDKWVRCHTLYQLSGDMHPKLAVWLTKKYPDGWKFGYHSDKTFA